jgi:hypothetical protein
MMVYSALRYKEIYSDEMLKIFDVNDARDAFFKSVAEMKIKEPEQLTERWDVFDYMQAGVFSCVRAHKLQVKEHVQEGPVMIRWAVMSERIAIEFDDPAMMDQDTVRPFTREYFQFKREYLQARGWRIVLVPYHDFIAADTKTQNALVVKMFKKELAKKRGQDFEVEWNIKVGKHEIDVGDQKVKDEEERLLKLAAMNQKLSVAKQRQQIQLLKRLEAERRLLKITHKREKKMEMKRKRMEHASKPTIFEDDDIALSPTARNDKRIHDILAKQRVRPVPGTLGLPSLSEIKSFHLEDVPKRRGKPSAKVKKSTAAKKKATRPIDKNY